MTTSRPLAALAVGLLTVGILSGCALSTPGAKNPAVTPGTGSSASSAPAAASHQQKLTAVPSTCPDPAEISVSVHISLPYVYPTALDGDLTCEYVDPSKGNASDGVVIVFMPAQGMTPAAWLAEQKGASPSLVEVAGVGDAAIYAHTGKSGILNFLSGPVAVNIYSGPFVAPQSDLVALAADQILVP